MKTNTKKRIFNNGSVSVWNETTHGNNETALYLGGARVSVLPGHSNINILKRAKELSNDNVHYQQ